MLPYLTRRAFGLLSAGVLLSPALAKTATPKQAYPKLRRGMNFHHLLNWPEVKENGARLDYVWPPFAAPAYELHDAELARLRMLGFDFLRVTAAPSIFIVSPGARRVSCCA